MYARAYNSQHSIQNTIYSAEEEASQTSEAAGQSVHPSRPLMHTLHHPTLLPPPKLSEESPPILCSPCQCLPYPALLSHIPSDKGIALADDGWPLTHHE